MRGVSEIIVIVLIVLIVVSIVGMSYVFLSGLTTTTQSAAEKSTIATTSRMTAQMKVLSMSANDVYIRNTGQTDLSNFTVLINGIPVNFTVTPSVVSPGTTGTIKIYDFIESNDDIELVSFQGAQTALKASDPCEQAVLCLDFDSDSGTTTAYDSSPNHNNAVLSGATRVSKKNWINFTGVWYAENKEMHESTSSLDFQDDYLYDPSSSAVGNSWTAKVDVKHLSETVSGWNGAGINFGSSAPNWGSDSNIVLDPDESIIRLSGFTDNANIAFTNSYNEWYKLRVKRTGNTVEIYVNDQLKATRTATSGGNHVSLFSMREHAHFDNYRLTDAQGSIVSLDDFSDSVLNFDGLNNYINLGKPTNSYSDGFTISFSIRPNSFGSDFYGNQILMFMDDCVSNGYGISFKTGGGISIVSGSGWTNPGDWEFSTGLTTGNWYQMSFVWKSTGASTSTQYFYLNNRLVGTRNLNIGTPGQISNNFLIGNFYQCWPARYLNAVIDDVRIYNKAIY